MDGLQNQPGRSWAELLDQRDLRKIPPTSDRWLAGDRGRPASDVFWRNWKQPCIAQTGSIGRTRIVEVDKPDARHVAAGGVMFRSGHFRATGSQQLLVLLSL